MQGCDLVQLGYERIVVSRGRKPVGGEPRPLRLSAPAVTAAELAHVKAVAESRGMTITDLIRTVCDLPVVDGPRFRRVQTDPELAQAYRELAAVLRRNFASGTGNNLDQISRCLNIAAQKGDVELVRAVEATLTAIAQLLADVRHSYEPLFAAARPFLESR